MSSAPPPPAPAAPEGAGLAAHLPFALLSVGLAAFVAEVPLGGMAHVTDEVAYTLQARLFAAGMRTGPPGDVPALLDYPFWVSAGPSHSPFPPGWPALLAVGVALGAPWLVNALLAGVLPLVAGAVGRAWGGARVGLVAAAVAAVSPQWALLAGSRMAHASVVAALGALLLVGLRAPAGRAAWAGAGLALGYVVLARPFDAAVAGGPLLLWALARAPGAAARGLLLVGPAVGAALLAADHAHLTGDPLRFPMSAWFEGWWPEGPRPGCNALGFGPDRGCVPTEGSFGHTPAKAWAATVGTLGRLDALLLGVPGGLLVAVAGLLRGRRWGALGLGVAVVAGHALYWSPGLAYGARFAAPALLVLPVGVALALDALPARVAARHVVLAVLLLGLAGGSRLLPELASDYWCVGRGAAAQVAAAGLDAGLLMVDGRGTRAVAWPRLGVPAFTCDPMLTAGEALQWLDPSRPTGGLQVRHAPRDAGQRRAFRDRHQPGAPIWVLQHDIPSGEMRLFRDPEGAAGEGP